MSADWVLVRKLTTRSEAEVVRGLLESHGIPTLVQADDLGGLRPELAFAGGIQVLVRAEDRSTAFLVLNSPEEASDEGSES